MPVPPFGAEQVSRGLQYAAPATAQAANMHEAAFTRAFRPRCRTHDLRNRLPASGSAERPRRSFMRRALPVLALVLALTIGIASSPSHAAVAQICSDCELFLGIGNTYHFWGETGGLVIPATLTFDHDRYELGLFRMTSRQTLYEPIWGKTRVLAEPYWGISASRRWRLVTRPTWSLFFGFGASYKTEEDLLNATHWNFAEQLAVRLHHPSGRGPDMEFAIRHWSNAGIRCPNRGQDFFTVSVAF